MIASNSLSSLPVNSIGRVPLHSAAIDAPLFQERDRARANRLAIGGMKDPTSSIDRLRGKHREVGALLQRTLAKIMSAAPKFCECTLQLLGAPKGREMSEKHLDLFRKACLKALPVPPDLPEGLSDYKSSVHTRLLWAWT
eukprot:6474019-Amphidinium_carterae.1